MSLRSRSHEPVMILAVSDQALAPRHLPAHLPFQLKRPLALRIFIARLHSHYARTDLLLGDRYPWVRLIRLLLRPSSRTTPYRYGMQPNPTDFMIHCWMRMMGRIEGSKCFRCTSYSHNMRSFSLCIRSNQDRAVPLSTIGTWPSDSLKHSRISGAPRCGGDRTS